MAAVEGQLLFKNIVVEPKHPVGRFVTVLVRVLGEAPNVAEEDGDSRSKVRIDPRQRCSRICRLSFGHLAAPPGRSSSVDSNLASSRLDGDWSPRPDSNREPFPCQMIARGAPCILGLDAGDCKAIDSFATKLLHNCYKVGRLDARCRAHWYSKIGSGPGIRTLNLAVNSRLESRSERPTCIR